MRLIISLVLCIAVCGLSNTAPAVQSQTGCQNVRGTVEADITGTSGACRVATIEGQVFGETGTLIGSTSACITNFEQLGNGAIHADLSHEYSIGPLNFSTDDQGVLTEIAPDLFRFENSLTIVDGATGFLRAHGTVNLDSGEINLTFNGRICVE